MLLNYRNILLVLSTVSSMLCDNPQDSDDGFLISYSSDPHEHLSDEPPLISNLELSSFKTTDSSTGYAADPPANSLPAVWEPFHDHGDDADEEYVSLFASQFFATQEPSNRSTASTNSPSSTSGVTATTDALNPIQADLDWLTSATDSTTSDGKKASSASSTGLTSPHRTTTTSTTTISTTDPAKAALDWLTSGLDGKSESSMTSTTTTTTDSKHSSVVSAILSEVGATHTSVAAANRLRLRFW